MTDKKQIHLKAGADVPETLELRNGSIYVSAKAGETVEVDARQYALAMRSGHFADGKAPKAKKETPAAPVE